MSKLNRQDGTLLTLGTIGALAVAGLVRGGRGSSNKTFKAGDIVKWNSQGLARKEWVLDEDPLLTAQDAAELLRDPDQRMKVESAKYWDNKIRSYAVHRVEGKGRRKGSSWPFLVEPGEIELASVSGSKAMDNGAGAGGLLQVTGAATKNAIASDLLSVTTDEILRKLHDPKFQEIRGEWDEANDYDDGEFIFSFGRETDPDALTPTEVVEVAKVIRSVLSKHGLHLSGGIRVYAHGSKVTFHASAREGAETKGSKAKASKWVIMAKLREHLGDVEHGTPRALRKQNGGWLVEYRDLSGRKRLVVVNGRQDSRGAVTLWTRPVERSQE